MISVIEIFQNGNWLPAAEIEPLGPHKATFEYRYDYVFSDTPKPLSLTLPVTGQRIGLTEQGLPDCPAFLLDLVPQGPGRRYLLDYLGVADGEMASDLQLVQYGAFNPIGNLRLDSAVRFYRDHTAKYPEIQRVGFTLDEITARSEPFLEHIRLHAMLSAGTTGVQGAAPKFLLTRNGQGLFFADAVLPDTHAQQHWLVKLPRGSHVTDYQVMHNEVAYLNAAKACGLRVHGTPICTENMLFVERFDRVFDEQHRLQRLHQESLASLIGLRGFGQRASQFRLAEAIIRHTTDPAGEIIEFMKRDIMNLCMRNPDNHARNSALQVLLDGTVQLTPLYDFAPMYLDREMITRACKWQKEGGVELTDWRDIVDELPLSGAARQQVLSGLGNFLEVIRPLPEIMHECEVDEAIIADCLPTIAEQCRRLAEIK